MAKEIVYDVDARERLREGADALANAVKVTSFLICECKGTDFWHTHQIFGEEILEKFSGISLETVVTR